MKGTLLKDFGGADRYLRYDANALARLGEVLGIKVRLGHFEEDLFNVALPLSAPRTLIWAGLLHAEEDLAEKQVGAWIDDENFGAVADAFLSRFAGMSPLVQEAARSVMGEAAVQVAPSE